MRREVAIELDKERHLRYTMNSLAKVEEKLGKSISELGKNMGIRELRLLLWAGLLHEDKTLTIEKVGALMDLKPLKYITDKIMEALMLALGEQEGDEQGEV